MAANNFVDSRDFARIARAIRYIEAHFREQPRLADIASHAGLSEFHFNRLFRRWAGVTPKQYLAFVTGNAAKGALLTQPSVLDAAYSVGLSGPGRLHDLIVTLDAMTPGELKLLGRGTVIRHGFSDTPFGRALLATTTRGVCHLAFVEAGKEKSAVRELQEQWPDATLEQDDAHALNLARQIWAGEGKSGLQVSVGGTNFQLKVWQALVDLGGQARTTYTALAEWYEAHGVPGPHWFSAGTLLASAFVNETLENKGVVGDNTDAIADFFFFDIGGIILFSFDWPNEFFSKTLIVADWSLQPSFTYPNFDLHNQGNYFSVKFPLPFYQRLRLFSYMGLGTLFGLSYQLDGQYSVSGAAGTVASRLVSTSLKNADNDVEFAKSAGLFVDRNNSLLASFQITNVQDYFLHFNLYPNVFATPQLGMWAVVDKSGQRVTQRL